MSVILVALGLLVALLLITEAMIVHSENHCTQRFRYFSPKVHTLKVVMYLLCKVVYINSDNVTLCKFGSTRVIDAYFASY